MVSESRVIIGSIVAGLMLCAPARGIVADSANPYQGIVDRNVFGLKPPPPPATNTAVIKKVDPPKVEIAGITTILGKKHALLNVEMPAKPPNPAKRQSFILAEGEREGEIEVLEINEKTGSVKVMDFGTEMALTMDKNAAKLPNTPMTPVPGAPPPAAISYTPPQPPAANPALTPARSIPTRTLRLPGAGTGNPGATPNVNLNPAGTAVPSYSTPPPRQSANQLRPLSNEEEALIIEAHAHIADDETARVMLPTELSPNRNTVEDEGPGGGLPGVNTAKQPTRQSLPPLGTRAFPR
jgi:hypothetical protein